MRLRSFWLVFVASAALAVGCQSSLKTATYREMVVDPATLHVTLETPIPIELDGERRAEATLGEYYQIFVGQRGSTSIDHYVQSGPAGRRMRYGHFESGSDRMLAKSERTRAVLQGAFGTVYSEITCFYNLPAAEYPSSVEVHAYANGFEHEAPAVSAEPPAGISDERTNFSLIRILRGAPDYVVVSATYSAQGRMSGFSVDGAKDGDWVHSNYVEGGGRFYIPDGEPDRWSAALTRFGLPPTIDVEEFLKAGRVALPSPGAFRVEREVFNVHYAYDRWIRQDDFTPHNEHRRRYLTSPQTPEDAVLLPRCVERFRG